MEPVSHVVFASAINRGVLRLPPQRGTGLAIMLGALSPDIDLALLAAGWDRYLVAHQAGTHSLGGALVCGTLAALLTRLLRPRSAVRTLLLPAIVAAWSHLVADLLSGGILRLLWPIFDVAISNAGAVAFGDPYSVALFLTGGLLMWIGKSRRERWSAVVLIAFAILCIGKFAVRERAVGSLRAGAGTYSYLVEPEWGSLTAWRIFAARTETVQSMMANGTGQLRLEGEVPRVAGDAAAVEASRAADAVKNLQRSHDFTFALGKRGSDGQAQVVWSDLRYCPPAPVTPDACAIAILTDLDAAGRVLRTAVRIGEYLQPR